jgi:hypothetical protein
VPSAVDLAEDLKQFLKKGLDMVVYPAPVLSNTLAVELVRRLGVVDTLGSQ